MKRDAMAMKQNEEVKDRTQPVVIPPTEVAHNHNPQPKEHLAREAENIPDGQMEGSSTPTGDEITDGEDA